MIEADSHVCDIETSKNKKAGKKLIQGATSMEKYC